MRLVGYALAVVGAAVLAGYFGYLFVADFVLNDEISAIVRVGGTGVVVGGLLVLGSLIRERLRDQRGESFRGVEK